MLRVAASGSVRNVLTRLLLHVELEFVLQCDHEAVALVQLDPRLILTTSSLTGLPVRLPRSSRFDISFEPIPSRCNSAEFADLQPADVLFLADDDAHLVQPTKCEIGVFAPDSCATAIRQLSTAYRVSAETTWP